MSSKIFTVELSGLQGQLVEIEVDTRMSLPGFSIVGLPDTAVQEARERVMSAVKNAGYSLPRGKIVVNMAPANIKKAGARYDLPIALGLIGFSKLISREIFKETIFLGELALDGTVRPTSGILATVEFAKQAGFKKIFLPKLNATEAALIKEIEIFPVGHLKEAILYLNKKLFALPIHPTELVSSQPEGVDMCTIKGQAQAKRALEIAAAGGHNILLNGAPGAGKTMMARAFSGILPDMTQQEMLEVTKIYSVAGKLTDNEFLIRRRPFRGVHHTASAVSIVGGGTNPLPGEVTLAHRGVLFLDEFAEFPSHVLEVLRQPMEDKFITISRAKGSVVYPAQFTLVAAMNPCPCGYHNVISTQNRCECPMWRIKNYHKKLSGPLLDRIDLHLQIQPVEHKDLENLTNHGESSEKIRKRVNKAYGIQINRFKNSKITKNAEMDTAAINKFCVLDAMTKKILLQAADVCQLSARSYYKIIKIARTIADLQGEENIITAHVTEALSYLLKNKV